MQRISLAVAMALAVSCATTGGLNLAPVDREKAQRQYVNRELVLGSSQFVTDFFGRDDWLFVDPRPFDIIELKHHGGSTVPVGVARDEIIAAGTPVRIKEIVFPLDPLTAPFMDERSALAPTAHTWVLLERTGEGASRTPLVMVLPYRISGPEGFEAAIQARLKSPAWVTSWLTLQEPVFLDKIYRKEVVEGMTWAGVQAALGEPKSGGPQEDLLEFMADYGDLQITIQGNKVSKVRSLEAEAAEARRLAAEAAEKARIEEEQRRAEEEAARAVAEEERKKREEEERIAREKREEEERIAREQAEAKAVKVRTAEEARLVKEQERRRQEEEKREAQEDARRKKEELEARLQAAKLAKEEAQREREQQQREAELARKVATAEAEAEQARRQADDAAGRAARQAEAERKLTDRQDAERAARARARAAATAKQLRAELTRAEAALEKSRVKSNDFAADAVSARHRADESRARLERLKSESSGRRRIGVKVQPVSEQVAAALGLEGTSGAFISDVAPKSEAAAGGVTPSDIVLEINGQAVADPRAFVSMVAGADVTVPVLFTVLRAGKRVELKLESEEGAKLRLEASAVAAAEREAKSKEELAAHARADTDSGAREVEAIRQQLVAMGGGERRKIGVKVEPVKKQLAAALRLSDGQGAFVAAVKPGSEAAQGGLEANDVVLGVNGKPVASADLFTEMVGDMLPFEVISVEVLRKGKRLELRIPPQSAVAGAPPAAPAAQPASEPEAAAASGRAPPDPRNLTVTLPESEEQPSSRRPVGAKR